MSRRSIGAAWWAGIAVVGLLHSSGAVRAATAEARRHVDAQGIEFINSRQTAASVRVENLPPAPMKPARAGSAGSMAVQPTPVPAPARVGQSIVSEKEQRSRDQDRLAILQQELNAETGHYRRTRQALDQPAVKGIADRDASLRLIEQLGRHEQNIKALHAEIRRTQATAER
jgi:hypothetical protein